MGAQHPERASDSDASGSALAESLRQSEEQFDKLVDRVEDYAIFLLDPRGVVKTWNAGARRIKGYEAPEIIGRHFSVFFPREQVERGWPLRELEIASTEGHCEDEGWRLRKDGSRFWASVVITALVGDDGRLRGFMKITRDLTERRIGEEQLRRAHAELELRVAQRTAELEHAFEQLRCNERRLELADERKDRFLAVLAHELRNPLAPVRTALEVLQRVAPADPRMRKAMTIMDRQVAHMTRLVDDLLDVSRITSGKLHIDRDRHDLREIVRAVLEDHRAGSEARGISLVHELRPEPVWVDGDDMRLAQAIGNLITNALKFTPSGGDVRVDLAQEHDRAVVHVSDTGVGIGADLLAHVFEPFAQGDDSMVRAHGGLGIGLSLVRALVELHGGTVTAESDGEHRGATFTVRLPLAAATGDTDRMRRASIRVGAPRRVLVIEDNVDAADTMAMYLSALGHEVDIANSGASGLALAESRRPEVVICDIGLADMSGLEVAQRLRRVLPDAYLLALTGYGQEEDRRKSRAAGFDLHATKPMDMATLDAIVANLGPPEKAGERASRESIDP